MHGIIDTKLCISEVATALQSLAITPQKCCGACEVTRGSPAPEKANVSTS